MLDHEAISTDVALDRLLSDIPEVLSDEEHDDAEREFNQGVRDYMSASGAARIALFDSDRIDDQTEEQAELGLETETPEEQVIGEGNRFADATPSQAAILLEDQAELLSPEETKFLNAIVAADEGLGSGGAPDLLDMPAVEPATDTSAEDLDTMQSVDMGSITVVNTPRGAAEALRVDYPDLDTDEREGLRRIAGDLWTEEDENRARAMAAHRPEDLPPVSDQTQFPPALDDHPEAQDAARVAGMQRIAKVLNRILKDRQDIQHNPTDPSIFVELGAERDDWEGEASAILDGYLSQAERQADIPNVTEEDAPIDYDALGEIEWEYHQANAEPMVESGMDDLDGWIDGYYEQADNWEELTAALVTDFDLTEQQVQSMGSQEIHDLIVSDSALQVLAENGIIEEGEYENIADVQLEAGGTAGTNLSSGLTTTEMLNGILWDHYEQMSSENMTINDLENYFGGLPREEIDPDTIDTEGEISYSDNWHFFTGSEDGEVVSVLSARISKGELQSWKVDDYIARGIHKTMGLSEEEVRELSGETFVTLEYLAAKRHGAGYGTEMILQGLRLAHENNAGIIGSSVEDASTFYDKMGARWSSEDGAENGGTALWTPSDVKEAVTWLEAAGIDVLSGDIKESAEDVSELLEASLTMRFNLTALVDFAPSEEPAAHFSKRDRADYENMATASNEKYVQQLDQLRAADEAEEPVERHGDHEGQKGREGERGGSQEGYSHTGAQSGGGKSGGKQSHEDRMEAAKRWDSNSWVGEDGESRPTSVYHGTSADMANQIASEGLRAAEDTEDRPAAVYFFTGQAMAEQYGSYIADSAQEEAADAGEEIPPFEYAVVEFEVPAEAGEDVIQDNVPEAWKLEQDIPPEWIKAVHVYEGGEVVETIPVDAGGGKSGEDRMRELGEGVGGESVDFSEDSKAADTYLQESYLDFAKSLTPPEIKAITDYKGLTFFPVNDYLRGEEISPSWSDEEVEGHIAGLDAVFGKEDAALIDDMVLYRGMDLEDQFERHFDNLEGEVFKFEGFTSTSASTEIPLAFAGPGEPTEVPDFLSTGEQKIIGGEDALLVKIIAPAGTKAVAADVINRTRFSTISEQEILLDRGYSFRVIETGQSSAGKTMTVEVIPDTSANSEGSIGFADAEAKREEREMFEAEAAEMEQRAVMGPLRRIVIVRQDEETSQENDTSQIREVSEESEDQEADPKRRDYWVWGKSDIELMDKQDHERMGRARDREARKYSDEVASEDVPETGFALVQIDEQEAEVPEKEEETEEKSMGTVERALTNLTNAIAGLVQRQEQPAPVPEIKVEVNPVIEVNVPETKVELEFPEHEQVMVVERDEEGFISQIRKRFTRPGVEVESSGPGFVKSISKIVREGFGLGPKDEQ
jgi:hypothetical protein